MFNIIIIKISISIFNCFFFPTAETVKTSFFALLEPVRARTKKRPATMERFLLPNSMLKPKIGALAFGVALAILIGLNSPIWGDAPQLADPTAPTAPFTSPTFNISVSVQPVAPQGPSASTSALFSTIGASAICDNHGVPSLVWTVIRSIFASRVDHRGYFCPARVVPGPAGANLVFNLARLVERNRRCSRRFTCQRLRRFHLNAHRLCRSA